MQQLYNLNRHYHVSHSEDQKMLPTVSYGMYGKASDCVFQLPDLLLLPG